MAVFRVERNTGYTVMSNHHLRNRELTLKAKGLLSQMLSLPEDWDYTLAGLSHINREKIDAIREAVRELERAGYIVRSRERDAKGRLRGADYVIYEQPQLPPKPDLPTLENPTLENPTQENPTLEKPTQENPMQLNKEVQRTNLSKKEKSNTDTQRTHSIPILSPAPSPLEGQAAAPPERKRKEPDDAYRVYEEIVKDNICYDILKQDMPYDHDRIKAFESTAKKYGIDFALKKDAAESPPRYLVFFKARDADALIAAFKEFSAKKLSREQKPSIRKALAAFRDKAKQLNANREKVKKKERGIDR